MKVRRSSGGEGSASGTRRAVWTIGYEGMELGEFIDRLRGAEIGCLVDVRRVAWSHKHGFRREQLRERLEVEGIGYMHMPQLGTPKEVQSRYKAGGSREEFLAAYQEHLRGQEAAVAELLALVLEKNTALMCFEADPVDCHRSALADELARTHLLRVDL